MNRSHLSRVALGIAVTTTMAGASSAAGSAQDRADAVRSASAKYAFVNTPVLTYAHGVYGLVWRLNRDLPRKASGRARATLIIEEQQALAVLGGGKKQLCFSGHTEGIAGGPRFGDLYSVVLEIRGANTLRKHVRLRHATKGYGAFYGNDTRDPKVRQLHCGPR
jgi:hypothetical protein